MRIFSRSLHHRESLRIWQRCVSVPRERRARPTTGIRAVCRQLPTALSVGALQSSMQHTNTAKINQARVAAVGENQSQRLDAFGRGSADQWGTPANPSTRIRLRPFPGQQRHEPGISCALRKRIRPHPRPQSRVHPKLRQEPDAVLVPRLRSDTQTDPLTLVYVASPFRAAAGKALSPSSSSTSSPPCSPRFRQISFSRSTRLTSSRVGNSSLTFGKTRQDAKCPRPSHKRLLL
jgi:hypothetical protein